MEDIDDKRYRSPSFNHDEVNALINLVEKYKLYVLNKSTTTSVCQAKVNAWSKISKQYNSLGLPYFRSADNLKSKWDNLKKDVRKITKNVFDDSDFVGMNSEHARVAALIVEADKINTEETQQDIIEEDEAESKDTNNSTDFNSDSEEEEKCRDYLAKKKSKISRLRSANFSNEETRLLLECLKKEKKYIFSKDTKSVANELKNRAWSRVTSAYNKLSPEKRSTKTLKNRLIFMKRMVRYFGPKDSKNFKPANLNSADGLINEISENIKQEPQAEVKTDDDSDVDADDDIESNKADENLKRTPDPDPLSVVLNSDSGLGSSHAESWNWYGAENKDIIRLKRDLLNYQMETAKLERKRIETLMQEEAADRQARATETALRLRAARLEAVAATLKFPLAHPALQFTQEEARAQHVLAQVPLPDGTHPTSDFIGIRSHF